MKLGLIPFYEKKNLIISELNRHGIHIDLPPKVDFDQNYYASNLKAQSIKNKSVSKPMLDSVGN